MSGKSYTERGRRVMEEADLTKMLREYRKNCGRHAIRNARVRQRSEERLWREGHGVEADYQEA